MKTALLYSASLSFLLLAAQTMAATDVVTDWNAELYVVQQATSQNTPGRTRADAILGAVVDATRNGLKAEAQTGRPAESMPAGANLDAASLQAAYSAMAVLYPQSLASLDAWLAQSLAGVEDSASARAAGKVWGEHVAQVVLADLSDAVLLNADTFAEAAQPPTSPTSAPDVQAPPSAEQAAIGPGRYLFSVLAGAPGTKGYVDATGAAARFDNPGGIAVDASGNVYVSEQDMGTIRKISPDGVVTTLAGTAGQIGSQDGAGAAARFSHPLGLAVDNAGNVLVADYGNDTIRKIDPSGNVTTLAGTSGKEGDADGTRDSARLYHPSNIAVDAAGNYFVTQDALYGSNLATPHALIRQVAPDGTVSTITVPFPASRSYYAPDQIAVDRSGNVYVSAMLGYDGSLWDDRGVLQLRPTGEMGKYEASELEPPDGYYGDVIGISMDETGSLLIRSWGDPIHIYTPSSGWQVRYPAGVSDLDSIKQVVVGKSGVLYTIPTSDGDQIGAVEVGVFYPEALGPVLLTQPLDETIRLGDTAGFSVVAVGGPALTFQWYFDSTPINGATSRLLSIQNTQVADMGRHYSVVVTDGADSIISKKANIAFSGVPLSSSGSSNSGTGSSGTGTGTSTGTSGSVTGSSGAGSAISGGGGSLDPRSSLAVLLLLAARAARRRAIKHESTTRQ